MFSYWLYLFGGLITILGWGRSLEWATSCPPPRHNFTSIPRIRSESPAFDLHHPELALTEYEANETAAGHLIDAGEDTGRVEELQARTRDASRSPNETAEPPATTDDAGAPRRENDAEQC